MIYGVGLLLLDDLYQLAACWQPLESPLGRLRKRLVPMVSAGASGVEMVSGAGARFPLPHLSGMQRISNKSELPVLYQKLLTN